MGTIRLPQDFKDFLKLLNSKNVEYLVIGGYAVSYHGHPRSTGDMDVWVAVTPTNAQRIVEVLHEFGFNEKNVSVELFLTQNQIIRFGIPPIRIEIMTSISGVEFADCYRSRITDIVDGVPVNLINLDDLKRNKKAAGRHKDLGDLESLP
jgi:predicted nucleotidyltransferase